MAGKDAENLLAIGQEIAGCRVVEFLGAGGMGQVYKCEHLRLENQVALKILPSVDSKSIKYFLREARLAAKIVHPNVVVIHDVNQDPATKLHFIIMQLINGRNLAQLVAANQRPIPWRQALKLIRGASKGAAAVHDQGLVHRDIKPANIMFSTATRQAVLMDFGLVREIDPSESQSTAAAVGTPMFMSPEQCRGASDLDARSDIVSLGRTLYFLLTARMPYGRNESSKNSTLDIMQQIVSGRVPTPAHQINPVVPPEVSQLVECAMAHDRERRFQSAKALIAAIDQLQSVPDLPDTTSYQTDAGAEAIGDLPELELITDGSAAYGPSRKNWLVAGGILATCLLVVLAFILNRDPRKDGARADTGKSPGASNTQDNSSKLHSQGKTSEASKPDTGKMIRIPAGMVHMANSDAELRQHANNVGFSLVERDSFVRLGSEQRLFSTEIPAFRIDKYEVTNGEYAVFVQQKKRPPPKHWNGASQPPKHLEDHPVVWVSHKDASDYAVWANKKLPTDAQWLRAFRADTKNLFAWGNTWDSARANVLENRTLVPTSSVTTTSRDVSTFDVCNMVGNAREMLRDLQPRQGLTWVVARGSDWNNLGQFWGTAAFPFLYEPGLEVNDVTGFRCVYEGP